ncbi:MAG: hypothetical protein H0V40_01460, partial [Actinobacteria bacterium]|nr:hypothetical protein [Actinomycetota bacterium]
MQAPTNGSRHRVRFENAMSGRRTHILAELRRYEDALRTTSGLFEASSAVEQREFSLFVRTAQVARSYPGAAGLAYIAA